MLNARRHFSITKKAAIPANTQRPVLVLYGTKIANLAAEMLLIITKCTSVWSWLGPWPWLLWVNAEHQYYKNLKKKIYTTTNVN
jgi:hypothetical protein